MQKILRLIQENQSSTTHQHLEQTLLKLNNLIDHEYFLFGLSLQTSLTKSETLITDNYPLSWRQQYDESEFMLIDPIVAYSMNNFLPIQWSQMRAQNPH